MIVALTGAIKNSGDYLIGDRSLKLLQEFVDPDIVNLSRFEPLDTKLTLINSSRALFLAGGPAYAHRMFPDIYPITNTNIEKIKVPIIPFGLGWSGIPADNHLDFRFDETSLKVLKHIHSRIEFSSCRDIVTQDVLKNNGINNAIMTGCPVWYDLKFIGREVQLRNKIQTVVITPPASPKYFEQLWNLFQLLKKRFPKANFIFSYHRGILPDKYTSMKAGSVYSYYALRFMMAGCKVRDVSYSLDKMDFYSDCDMHIGYRVHAHLFFLSQKKISFLINEDGRGLGMARSLKMPEFNAWERNVLNKLNDSISKIDNNDFGEILESLSQLNDTFYDMKKFLKGLKV